MPKAEIILWSVLKGKKMKGYKFRRQHGIGSFIVDFYCPELKLAIELDGSQHLEQENLEYDKKRTQYLNSLNIKVIRFLNNEVLNNIGEVYVKIKEYIDNLLSL